ncbi:flagellin [Yersinia kristensenii]|uniref:flagellin N-terminal helical domain-containing protein n=1 Tax=Yersinia kristensenii TaxID=28152 RepID=UPI0005E19475|nr:flagellin [Yersinia kristensenii]CNG87984.1 putative flagellin FlaA [Yersinia kristensenii]CNK41993.1 putative flagellin FlaA [Yersinia kristensenii]
MGLSINDQSQAFIAAKALNKSQSMYNKSTSQLSTGLRILSAKDDAAGSQIAAGLNAAITGQNVALRNNSQSSAMLEAANGALAGSDGILNRMKELATQASNATNGAQDRAALNAEFKSLGEELKSTLDKSTFGDGTLFATGGKLDGELVFQTGASADDVIKIDLSTQVEGLRDTVSSAGTVGNTAASSGTIEKLLFDVEKTATDTKKDVTDGQAAFDSAKAAFDAAIKAGNGTASTGAVTTWNTANATYQDLVAEQAKADAAVEHLKKNDGRYKSGGLVGLDLNTADNAKEAITKLTTAISDYSSVTASLAAGINRLGYSSDNLTNMRDGNMAAKDSIMNADAVAASTAQNTAMLLMNSGIKALSKNTQMGQMVAQLF